MKDRGFVLVNVLILIAALSVVAVGLLQITTRATHRLDVAQGAAQAPLVIDAGVAFASRLLKEDALSSATDNRSEAWALSGYVAETALGPVRVTVTDLESRMNINRPLAADGALWEEALRGLLAGSPGGVEIAPALTARFARLRSDAPIPPNRTPESQHQSGDLTHLAAIEGIAAGVALPDGVLSALPRDRGININTADDAVLAALPGMTPEALAAINTARQAAPIADDAAVTALLQQIAPGTAGLADIFETESHWFVVETETQLNDLTYRGWTVLVRTPDTGEVRTHLHRIMVSG